MALVPLDLQVLYAQQGNVSQIEHTRLINRALLMQAEERAVMQDSYERDSTVVKPNASAEAEALKNRPDREGEGDGSFVFVQYKRKKGKDGDDIVEEERVEGASPDGKGRVIDIMQ